MMKHILLLCVLVSIEKNHNFHGWLDPSKYELSVGILQVSSALSSAIKEAQVGIDCPMQVFLTSYFLT